MDLVHFYSYGLKYNKYKLKISNIQNCKNIYPDLRVKFKQRI